MSNPRSRSLFVYGTLRDAALVVELTGRQFAQIPATLDGYRRVEPDGDYAWIEPHGNAHVDGIVLCSIDERSMERLDAYEGDLYERRAVEVRTADGLDIECDTYVGLRRDRR